MKKRFESRRGTRPGEYYHSFYDSDCRMTHIRKDRKVMARVIHKDAGETIYMAMFGKIKRIVLSSTNWFNSNFQQVK